MAKVRIAGYREAMKLAQGQIWQKGDEYYRIVEWARLSIVYKVMKNPNAKRAAGAVKEASKKEFCRLLKGATLLTPDKKAAEELAEEEPEGEEEFPYPLVGVEPVRTPSMTFAAALSPVKPKAPRPAFKRGGKK